MKNGNHKYHTSTVFASEGLLYSSNTLFETMNSLVCRVLSEIPYLQCAYSSHRKMFMYLKAILLKQSFNTLLNLSLQLFDYLNQFMVLLLKWAVSLIGIHVLCFACNTIFQIGAATTCKPSAGK